VKLIVDTNILVRLVTQDNLAQEKIAKSVMREAELIVIPLSSLCELVWVLRRAYNFPYKKTANSMRILLETENVKLNYAAVEAGLATLEAGGDFADGVIAHEGKWLGGEVFASFDKEAVKLLKAQGQKVKQL
jgi:predicted nucleic-acid-binding protein